MIFVTGVARSGTSLVTQILQVHGCWLGKPNRINRLYENVDHRERVLKPYLRSIGVDPLGQKTLPEIHDLAPHPGLRKSIQRFFDTSALIATKDAKLSLVFPVWHEAFPEAKWVLVRRDREKIAESCLRTDFMRAYDGKSGWLRWVEAHEQRFEGMKRDLDLVEIWTDELVADPEAFRPVAEHCGLPFDPEATGKAINPDVWHGR